jgi:hypothetical protein
MVPASFTGCDRAGPAKSLGAWLRAAENGATVAQLEAIFG